MRTKSIPGGDQGLTVVLRGINIQLANTEDADSNPWLPADLPSIPTDGPDAVYILADGLASRSTPANWYTPWFNLYSKRLTQATSGGNVHTFSYEGIAKHYMPKHTNVDLLNASNRTFLPFALPGLPAVTYVPFSFAGPLVTIGLSAWIKTHSTSTPLPGRRIVMVQPALTMADSAVQILDVWKVGTRKKSHVRPGLINFTSERSVQVQVAVREAIRYLVAHGIGVSVIYWPEDSLIKYPAALMNGLERAGASLVPVEDVTFSEDVTDIFRQHVLVKTTPEILRKIEEILAP